MIECSSHREGQWCLPSFSAFMCSLCAELGIWLCFNGFGCFLVVVKRSGGASGDQIGRECWCVGNTHLLPTTTPCWSRLVSRSSLDGDEDDVKPPPGAAHVGLPLL